ncbi:pilus assembly protein Flp/PilA [Nitrosomonas sp. Nm84]|uniref:Flp family type IVb pilin n=1 Tax=Nitrosomonas sp. Nm84 TaxID=200124 RepID=UPI000D761F29|nr:Flp family type IVb pilin [Nitrosomonas sp. Nm84]PXW89745.1 pilus assembly protein Flp/PilA [Nitrosomonas sp. Nm84]
MEKLVQTVKQFWNDESGATAVEYGMMVALIAAVIVIAVKDLGGYINTAFGLINTQLQ